MKSQIRRAKLLLREQLEVLTGKRDRLTPPARLTEGVGGGDYKKIGLEFFRSFVDFGKLKPDDKILDVGCGCGRMALPLTEYLSQKGGYWGFDIVKDNIKWCRKNIGVNHPNFHFELADVFNQTYHPKGRFKASDYTFPYPDAFFDFVSLTSVFTHLLADDMLHYLDEITRVLKPGGRCFITYFILNEESKQLIHAGRSKQTFQHPNPNCRLEFAEHPEAAIAFEETFLREHYQARRLEITEPIFYGKWPGRTSFLTFQDVILATKKS